MRTLPAGQKEAFGLFESKAAIKAGWIRAALEHAVSTRRVFRVLPGWFIPIDQWQGTDPQDDRRRLVIRTAAAMGTMPRAVACSASAAVLADLPVWTLAPRPCLTVCPGSTARARCAHLHRAALTAADIVAVVHRRDLRHAHGPRRSAAERLTGAFTRGLRRPISERRWTVRLLPRVQDAR